MVEVMELDSIPFGSSELEVFFDPQRVKVWVLFRKVVEDLGYDFNHQLKVLENHPNCVSEIFCISKEGEESEELFVDIPTILSFISRKVRIGSQWNQERLSVFNEFISEAPQALYFYKFEMASPIPFQKAQEQSGAVSLLKEAFEKTLPYLLNPTRILTKRVISFKFPSSSRTLP